MRLRALFAFFFLSLVSIAASGASSKGQPSNAQYRIDKTPSWVVRAPASAEASVEQGATQILLSDMQVNLMETQPAQYVHMKTTARERAGLEKISTVKIAFNPRYESLTLHELVVLRDGKRIDRLKTARIDFAQREHRLEEGIYDEDVEAIIALADIRVGDVIEYSYTTTGQNPVFAGKFASVFLLQTGQPIDNLFVRIRYPDTRKLHYKLYRSDLPVNESVDGSVRTLSLNAQSLSPIRDEEGVPSWFLKYPLLQVSEYASWEEVGAWAKSLYAVPQDLSPEIEAVLDKLKKESNSPQQLAAKALAWVQNEIRYYSVAVGTSSHKPNHPNVTVNQRFGDCKDKSLLLSAMLQRLGIQAEPALVSYELRQTVAELLPMPVLFDHVIVRAQIDGQTYWLDGTQTYQGATLDTLGSVSFGKALPTASLNPELVDVPTSPNQVGTQVTETFKVTEYGVPTKLVVEEKYFGLYAEIFRRILAEDGLKRLVENRQANYGKDFPGIAIDGESVIDDDLTANVLTITQNFSVPELFRYEHGRLMMSSLYARSVIPWFRFPGTPNRRFPLSLAFPATFDHKVIVELPQKLPSTRPYTQTWQDNHVVVKATITPNGSTVSYDYHAKTLQNYIAPNEFESFVDKFKQKAWPLFFSSLQPSIVDLGKLRARLNREQAKASLGSLLSFRKPDQADNLRQTFAAEYAVADEVIGSGLVKGALLSKIYLTRAENESLLGNKKEALADAGKALELEQSDAGYILKSEIQLYSGNYQEALATLKSVTVDKDKIEVLMDAGIINFYLGNYAEAMRNVEKAAAKADSQQLGHILFWLGISAKKNGSDVKTVLSKYKARMSASADWPAPVVSLLLEESSPEVFLAAAEKNENEQRMRLCEAYFFLGEIALANGKPDEARKWFGKSVDTNVVMYREHALSQAELAKLDQ